MDKKKPVNASGLFETMTQTIHEKDDLLASELAMGVLNKQDLAVANARFDTDPEFRLMVEDWQTKLSPMLDSIDNIKPASSVWENIAASTIGTTQSEKNGLWRNLAFWRGASFVTGGIATASLAALIFFNTPEKLSPANTTIPLVASLTSEGKLPAFLARFDPQTKKLLIKVGIQNEKETRVAELWLIPADGIPRSLGVLDDSGKAALKITDQNKKLFLKGNTLAVSLEPQGGSPTGAPTGPVIASGKLQFL